MENKKIKKRSINLLISDDYNDDYIKFLKLIYVIKNVTIFSKFLKDYKKGHNQVNHNLLLFTGGSDISPKLYGENDINPLTVIDEERDALEKSIFDIYNGSGIPMLGICRGAQFLTVMMGGSLIQHVDNHDKPHLISCKVVKNKIIDFKMTSTHHQMMNPYNINSNRWDLISWSTHFKSNRYLNGKNEQIKLPELFLEPEIVRFRRDNILCIQGHPEHDDCDKKTKDFIIRLIKSTLPI